MAKGTKDGGDQQGLSLEESYEALQQSQRRMAQAQAIAHIGSWEWEVEAGTLYWSDEMYKIFGLEQDSTIDYARYLAGIHPEDRERVQDVIQEALATHEPFSFRHRIVRPAGDERLLHCRGHVIKNKAGEVIAVFGTSMDISEDMMLREEMQRLREAQDALRKRDVQMRLILDSTAEGIYGLDLRGHCTFANAACAHLLGYDDPDELLGMNMHNLIHHTYPNGTPYPEKECHIYKAFKQGRGTHVQDEVLWRKDGTSFSAEYWSYPMRHDDEVLGSVVTFVDITERRRAEVRMKAEGVVTRTLAESTSFEEAQAPLLKALREILGAQLAEIWFPDPDGQHLRCTERSVGVSTSEVAPFLKDTLAYNFEEGIGLPGRVWATCEPAWIADLGEDLNFPRASLADESGLQSGFAFPLHSGDEFFGVIAFYTSRQRWQDKGLLDMMAIIGGEIGQFISRKRAEKALHESEEQRRLALAAANLGTWAYNLETGKVWWDERCAEILGAADITEGTYEGVIQVVHPDDLASVEEAVEVATDPASSGAYEKEYRIVWPDTSIRWVSAKGQVHFEETGSERHPVRFVGTLMDITARKEAEAALRTVEERYRLTTTSAQIGTWDLDVVTGELRWDDQCKALFGLSPDVEVDYQVFLDGLHPEDRERAHRVVQQALDPEGTGYYSIDYRTVGIEDGILRWIAAQGQAYFEGEGDERHATRFLGTVIDITDRKEAEAALRESETLKGAILESALDCIITIDEEGRVLEFNKAAEETFGYRREDVINQLLEEYIIPPRLRSAHRQGMRHYHATGEGPVLGRRVEVPALHANGTEFPVELGITPVNLDGRELFTAYLQDITERKKSEETLRAAEERYRFLANSIPQQVWTARPDGQLDYVNQVVLDYFGRTFEKMIGEGWQDVVHTDDLGRCVDRWVHSLETGDPYEVEFRLLRNDGVYRWHLVRARPQYDDGGQIVQWFGSNTDIDEHKQMQAALADAKEAAEVANKAKGQFLANMSHELRTPLNAVIGYSELLQEKAEMSSNDAFIPELEKIHGAGRQLLALINDVLDLSKIEAGRMELYLDTFEVRPLIEEVISAVEPLFVKQDNTFEAHYGAYLGTIHADATKLRQMLFNLLGNAAKFTESGTITLDVERERDAQDWFRFRVTDTGIGMTKEQQQNLFESFYRAEEEGENLYEGTGLGLAITSLLCKMMGGEIGVESERGVGTTFTVRLPAYVTDTEKNQKEAPTKTIRVDDVKASMEELAAFVAESTVLVIDDDPHARDLLQQYLEREGFQVVVAAGGREGLKLARQLRPAAITLDVMMPGFDGWDVLSHLKSDAALADIPVVMVTIAENEEQAYALGATEYMTKPVDRQRLAQVLHRICVHPQECMVLVVDDDAATRDLVQQTLGGYGYQVEEAENGREALQQLIKRQPQVIVLDLMMPEIDGFALVEELSKHEMWRKIPVVVLTAKDLSEEERRRLNGRVEAILQKGAYSRDMLLHTVRSRIVNCLKERNA